MKTLHHTVSCAVVGGGEKAANPETAAELAEEARLKLRAAVGGEGGWDTKACYPLVDEGLDNG